MKSPTALANSIVREIRDPSHEASRRGGRARMSLNTGNPRVATLMARLLQEKGAATRAYNTARRCGQTDRLKALRARQRRAARAIARVQTVAAQMHTSRHEL